MRVVSIAFALVAALGCGFNSLHATHFPPAFEGNTDAPPVPESVFTDSGPMGPRFLDPLASLDDFMKAVDRGDVTVLKQRLERTMIKPWRVEYSYDASNQAWEVRIHADLPRPLSVPWLENCEADSVIITIDQDGRIVATEVHMLQK